MGDAIEHGDRQPLGLEDLRPILEGQVGGDDHASALVAFAEGLKEKISAVLGDRQVPELIDEDEIPGSESLEEAMKLVSFLGSLQLGDQLGRGIGSYALVPVARCPATIVSPHRRQLFFPTYEGLTAAVVGQ